MSSGNVRHILSLSGGKDSAALAIYMRQERPDLELEYVFCDTEKELPETYEYLEKLEGFLGQKIIRLKHDGRGFDHWLRVYGYYLPSPLTRWCTRRLKLQPFERYVGNDPIINYIGIRADEERDGYVSHKLNITAEYPFKRDGITRDDVWRILDGSSLGRPTYYKWRTRSGCYFCFFQQKIEWIGLLENHPDSFYEAKEYEERCQVSGERFTWTQGESLEELARPERIKQVKAEHQRRMEIERKKQKKNGTLMEVLSEHEIFEIAVREYDTEDPCIACHD